MAKFVDENGLAIVWNKVKAKILDLIDDSSQASNKTYSSRKIQTELDTLDTAKLDVEDCPTKISDLTDDSDFIHETEKGANNGIATLNASGKVPASQLPDDVSREYQGLWDASTNIPTITAGVGIRGDYYYVSTAGIWNGISFNVGDTIIFNGTVWEKHEGSKVNSVNGKTGDVVLNADDISFTNQGFDAQNVDDALDELRDMVGPQYIECTWAEYQAHPAWASDGNFYIIKDHNSLSDAATISVDSPLGRTVQLAFNNLYSGLSSIENTFDQVYRMLMRGESYEYGEEFNPASIWVNGKRIFRAVIYADNLAITNDTITTLVSGYNDVDKIISDEIFFNAIVEDDQNVEHEITANDKFLLYQNQGFIDFIVDNHQIYMYRKNRIALNKVYMIMEYTKYRNSFEDLYVEQYPTKLNYIVGEDFDPTGLIAQVYCSDTNYDDTLGPSDVTIVNGTNLQENQYSVTISYTYLNTTKTAVIPIGVSAAAQNNGGND